MKKILLCFLFLPIYVSACVNTYNFNLGGQYNEANEGIQYMVNKIWDELHTGDNMALNRKQLNDFYEVNHHHWTDSLVSDYAALLIKDFRLDEAKIILDSLIQKEPNNYTCNANYGTLMELMGDNEKALYYIKQAVQIDPESHLGSEWIHVKILEVKIALAKNPQWLNNNSVLPANHQPETDPYEYVRQLGYQLEERTYFIRDKDDIVCDLFFSMGKAILEQDMGMTVGRKTFLLSLRYGQLHAGDCKTALRILDMFPAYSDDNHPSAQILHTSIWVSITTLVIFITVILLKAKKRPGF